MNVSPALLTDLQIQVSMVLLGLALVCVPRAYVRAVSFWGETPDGWSRVLWGSTVVAAVLRWLIAPLWIVTMYIGYQLTDHAIRLVPWSRYGIASQSLYHVLLIFLPHDHRSLMWTNSVVGVIALPLIATVAARLLRDRRAGAIVGALLALVPLFIKNDNSDANNVPLHLWLFAGLVLWDEYLEKGQLGALVPAGALFALTAVSRPEMPLLLPIIIGGLTFGLAPDRKRLLDPRLFVVVLVAAAFALPHVIHVRQEVTALRDRESLPGLSGSGVLRMLMILVSQYNTVLSPSLYPVVLVPLALYGLADRSQARLRGAMGVTALASLAVYSLDLCRANMARVHVLGCTFVTMLAAAGLSRAWQAHARLPVRALLVGALTISAVPTAFTLWAPTNEQTEEEVAREAIAQLPAGDFTLLRFESEDRDRTLHAYFTHPYFPDYLITPPMRGGTVSAIRPWLRRPTFERPVYLYVGMRCYALFRPDKAPPPPGENLQAACAEIRAAYELEPVLERTVKNRGDVWLNYYGDAPTLRLGLYRVKPRLVDASR